MASLDDDWANFAGDSPKQAEITFKDRLILNNFFDTQPKKRAAYMDQLGFELDPKDDNKFKIKGSPGGYVGKIDPGPMDMASVYSKGGIKGVLKEYAADIGDLGFDVLAPAAGGLMGAAQGMGATANPWVGLAAGIGGSALTYASSEGLKAGIGDLILDKNIPQDMKLTAAQSLMAGLIPHGLAGGLSIAKNIKGSAIESTVKGIQNAAARFSGGKVTPEILTEAAKNPNMFSKGAVQGAEESIAKDYQRMFGARAPLVDGVDIPITQRPSSIPGSSDFGQALAPLNKAADQVEQKLSSDPRANIKVSDVLNSFKQIEEPFHNSGYANSTDESGLKSLEKFKNQFLNKVRKQAGPDADMSDLLSQEVPFGEVRRLSKVMKDGVKDENGNTISGGELVMQVAGSGDGQLGRVLNTAADKADAPWSQIQGERHNILELYNLAKQKLTPRNLENAFLGNDAIAKQDVRNTMQLLDAKFGTNYSEDIANQNYQRAFKNLYSNPSKSFGSGAVLPEMAKSAMAGAAKGAGIGAAAGAPMHMAGAGALVGGTVGAISGAADNLKYANMINPAQSFRDAIEKQLALDSSYSKVSRSPITKSAEDSLGFAGAPKMAPDVSAKPASLDDEWERFNSGQGGQ